MSGGFTMSHFQGHVEYLYYILKLTLNHYDSFSLRPPLAEKWERGEKRWCSWGGGDVDELLS